MPVERASGLVPHVPLPGPSCLKPDYLRRGDGDDNITPWEGDLG
jgi:hypothetical protein